MGKSKYKAIKVDGVKHDYHRWLMEQALGRELDFNEIVHHKNENKLDNDLTNLEILTRSEHAKMHAKPPYFTDYAKQRARETNLGKPAKNRKLSGEDARFIKEHYIPRDKEYGTRALARKFGVDHYTISKIVNDKFYKEC